MAASRNNTPSGVRATGLPTPHPRLVELIEREKMRTKIEAAVARLIDALDAIDGDTDREPSLGSPDLSNVYGWARVETACGQRLWAAGAHDDRELDTADDEETALERYGSGFARSGSDDDEDGGDTEANGDEQESSLGSLSGHMNQGHWSGGNPGGTDLEDEHDGREDWGQRIGCRP